MTTRQHLENSFKVDLSPVRVHSDTHASSVADSMSAYAFAYGSHIYLGSGQSAYNLGLMAHEVTHVVQQQGQPGLQMSSSLAVRDRFESEASSVSAAVIRGEAAVVHERASYPRIQGSVWGRITGAVGSVVSAVGRGVSAAASAVAEIGSGLLNAAYNYLKGRARSIPGYDLLGFVLGRDPISQEPIERNASNLIHAVLGLVPGGAEMWTNLQQANVINRVFEWLDPELAKLNLTWPIIRGLFQQAWNAFSLADAVANPGRVWDTMRDIFAPPLGRLVNFARAAGGKILEFIFEGALALGGSAAQQVLGIFRRAQAVFGLIVADPMRFVRNLIAAGVGGFRRFAANILDHLRTALFEWLLGALAGAGLQLPARWDFMGILSVVLQVLGLTYARIRERFVRLIGESAVRAIEVGFEFLRIIVTQGLAAAWEKILEFATGMIDTVIEGIRSWVVTSIVRAAVTRLATMFNPAGAIIQAIIATYNTVMFFIERAQQITAMVNSYLESIENIARGNLDAAMVYVERAMVRTLPIIISFLARLIGLGGIGETIRSIILRIQATVDRAIDRVIQWIRDRAAAILARITGGPDNRTPQQKQQDLNSGVAEAEAIWRDEEINIDVMRRRLGPIKSRYRLSRLEAVTDATTDNEMTVHFIGEVNPSRSTSPRKKLRVHRSRYVTRENGQYMLKTENRNKDFTRDACYAKSYRAAVNDWKEEVLTTMRGRTTPSGYQGLRHPTDPDKYWYNGAYYANSGNTRASIDHNPMVVQHWNATGRSSNQDSRTNYFNDIPHLTIVPLSVNSSAGASAGENYNYRVTIDFLGPGE